MNGQYEFQKCKSLAGKCLFEDYCQLNENGGRCSEIIQFQGILSLDGYYANGFQRLVLCPELQKNITLYYCLKCQEQERLFCQKCSKKNDNILKNADLTQLLAKIWEKRKRIDEEIKRRFKITGGSDEGQISEKVELDENL